MANIGEILARLWETSGFYKMAVDWHIARHRYGLYNK